MKRLLTITVILFSLLASSFEVSAGCTGTCTACSSFSSAPTCSGQAGCTWSGATNICSGSCTACTTYSSQSTCQDQSGCSWGASCGDNVCEGSEDCGCSDCNGQQATCQTNYFCSGGQCTYQGSGGTCSDAGGTCKTLSCGLYINCQVASGSCSTGSCCTGDCVTLVSSCGNDVCESGETCRDCASDCGLCSEQAINVAFREPINGDKLKRGPQLIKVATYYTSLTSEAKVYAQSQLFSVANLILYDDGAHNDDKKYDGIYAAYFLIKEDTQPGPYQIKVFAEGGASANEATIKVTVDPELKITLRDFKSSYNQGERMILNGEVRDFENKAPNVTVNLLLDWLGEEMHNKTHITNADGTFEDSYLISFADPTGAWNLKARASDEYGNSGETEIKSGIGIPEGVAYYVIKFLSPITGTTYSRGETVPITIEVTQEGKEVEKANVSFLTPTHEYLNLIEIEPGTYTTKYEVKFGDPLDQWRLAVQAVKTMDNVTKAGGNSMALQIKSGKIRFELISPTESNIFAATDLDYKVKLTYPDDTPVTGATLTAELSNNKTIRLIEKSPGEYSATYFVTAEDAGSLDAKIIANDNKGNTATASQVIVYVEKITPVEKYLKLSYRNMIRPYWWAILAAMTLIGLWYKPRLEVKLAKMSILKAKREQETVTKMQAEAEREYYQKGTVSKEQFRNLVQRYKERLAKAKEQQNTAEKKLKKLKA